ncbi:uncharacterized protein [Apostichopus japonicus]|uniref:uncharacterized protein isoform X4 n=1 Tax=Stichopus japonicus TaxID=307972 RepID=UPI003AB5B215
MANAEDELSAEGLKAYIDGHGGKVKNLDLVAHYSSALKHPKNKAANKKKFSQIVNEVAKVNIIEGEKFLVLKKKYKKDIEKLTFQPPTIDQHESEEFMLEEEPLQGRKRKVAAESSIGLHRDENELPRKVPQGENQLNHQNDSNGNNKLVQFQKEFESTEPQTIGYDSSVEQNERFNNKSSLEEEKVELPTRQPRLPRNQNTAPEFIVPEEEYQQKRIEEIESTPSISVLDTSSQIESVKNVADAFNDEGKNSENSPENSWKQNGVAGDPSPTASERKFTSNAESSHADHHDDDEEPPGWETGESVHSEESNGVHHSPVKLDALERKWMMASAYGKIPELNELLKQDPTLAKKRALPVPGNGNMTRECNLNHQIFSPWTVGFCHSLEFKRCRFKR